MADDPSQAVSYPMPEEQRITLDRSTVEPLIVFLTENGTLIYKWKTSMFPEDAPSYRLAWVEPDGSVSRTEDIELAGYPHSISAWLAVVSPIGGTVLSTVIPLMMANAMTTGVYEIEFSEALGRILVQIWPALLSAYVASGLAVWLCLRRQRRYGASGNRMWAVFVALFGLCPACWPMCGRGTGPRWNPVWSVASRPAKPRSDATGAEKASPARHDTARKFSRECRVVLEIGRQPRGGHDLLPR